MVQEAKIIEKVVVGFKQPKKIHKTQPIPCTQGNWKYPSAMEADGELLQMTNVQIQTEKSGNQTVGSTKTCSENDEPLIVEEVNKVKTIAGHLQYFINAGKEITDDKFILKCIRGHSIQFRIRHKRYLRMNRNDQQNRA